MKKFLTGLLIGLSLVGTTAYAISTFISVQVGTSPTNGYVLQTNGTNSTWVATSTLGLSGASGSSFAYLFPSDATTTKINFIGGLISNASSTVQNLNSASSTLGTLLVTGNATGTNLYLSGQFVLGGATTTGVNGIDISGGCFAQGGTCLQTYIQNATAYKSAANLAATTTLAGSPSYANGTGGVGATLTEVGFGALYVDGNSPAVGNRILVKNQTDQTTNGVYTVTVAGSAIASYVLTRAVDFNNTNDIYAGVTVPVISGTANNGTGWVMTTTGAIVLGTSNIVFAEASAAGGGVASFAQIFGSAQTGAITIATSTTAISNDWGITNTNGAFTFNIPNSTASVRGLLTGTDWTTFNAKQATIAATYPIILTGATLSFPATSTLYSNLAAGELYISAAKTVLTAATTTFSTGLTYASGAVTCDVATASVPGCLSAANWGTFNAKQAALGSLTGLVSSNGTSIYASATSTLTPTAPLGGSFVQFGTGGSLTCTGCATFGYPWTTSATFAGMSTSSLLNISGGVMSTASSTFQNLNVGTSTTAISLFTGTTTFNGKIGTKLSSSTNATAYSVDWDNGNTQKFVLSANSTFDINATSSHPVNGFFALKICNGFTAYTFTYQGTGAYVKPTFGQGTTTMPSTTQTCMNVLYQWDNADNFYSTLASTTNLR